MTHNTTVCSRLNRIDYYLFTNFADCSPIDPSSRRRGKQVSVRCEGGRGDSAHLLRCSTLYVKAIASSRRGLRPFNAALLRLAKRCIFSALFAMHVIFRDRV